MSEQTDEPSFSSRAPLACRWCGATMPRAARLCWICGGPLAVQTDWQPPAAPVRPLQMSLATVALVITLISICLAVFRVLPGLGVVLGLFSAAAVVRTIFVMNRERRRGLQMTVSNKVAVFITSVGVIFLALFAGFVAFLLSGWVVAAIAMAIERQTGVITGGFAVLGVVLCAFFGLGVAAWIIWAYRGARW